MILAATLLWAVEVILVKRLVVGLEARTLAAARMALGAVAPRCLGRSLGALVDAARPRRGAVDLGACHG